MPEKRYLVVGLTETDGDVQILQMTAAEIKAELKKPGSLNRIGDLDCFSIIDGEVIKQSGVHRLPREIERG